MPLHVTCRIPAPFRRSGIWCNKTPPRFTSRTTSEFSQCIWHLACKSGASLQAIKYLVEANGGAATLCAGDNDGHQFNHRVAGSDFPLFNTIDCAVKVHPAASSTRTSSGALPLQVLRGSTRPPLRMVQYLVNAHPANLSTCTIQGDLPITLLGESPPFDDS